MDAVTIHGKRQHPPRADLSKALPRSPWSWRTSLIVVAAGVFAFAQPVILALAFDNAKNLVGASLMLPLGAWALVVGGANARRRRALEQRLRAGGETFEDDAEWPLAGEIGGARRRMQDGPRFWWWLPVALGWWSVWMAAMIGRQWIFWEGAWVVAGVALLSLIPALRLAMAADVRVTYLHRPYRVDRPITLRIGLAATGSSVKSMRVALRCIRERESARRHGWGARRQLAERMVIYRAVVDLAPFRAVPSRDSDADVTFTVPPGVPGTRITAEWPTYWEAEVMTMGGAGTQCCRFLVPVYDEEMVPAAVTTPA